MKRLFCLLFAVGVACLLMGCQAFVTPMFQTSRDVSSQIADLSTKDIVANIDRFAGSPEKTVAVLNELGERQEEIKSLSPSEKSAVLKAGVSATIPMKEISSIADSTMNSGESGTDPNKVLESVLSSVPEMDTKALEVILESDFEGLSTQDIALSSVAVALTAVKKEGGETEDLATKLQGAIKPTHDENGNVTGVEFSDENGFEKEDSASALSAVVGALDKVVKDPQRKNEEILPGVSVDTLIGMISGGANEKN